MDDASLIDEAEDCRRKALSFLGKPEASFLLRMGREFERLAAIHQTNDRDRDCRPQH